MALRDQQQKTTAENPIIFTMIVGFGFRIPVVAKSSGEIVDGHLRLKAARRLGLSTVPVVLADELSDAQIKAFRLLANRSATWANWDDELLRLELEDLQAAEFDLTLTGFGEDELAALLASEESSNAGCTDDDAIPSASETSISHPGDVWLLGKHRLLCGDATQTESYAQLLQGEMAAMVFTDPPYGVNYCSTNDQKNGTHRPILNDNLGTAFGAFLETALTPMLEHCSGAVYIAMSSSELDSLQAAFRAAGGHWSTFIIWAKNTFTLGRSDYQRQYEPILYGWREGATRHWCGDRNQSDVWQINKPVKNDLHPTMKPVELVERAIRNSSRAGETVLDCFAGSGTTLIAAEKSGRIARLMELDPQYCDVVVRRWQKWTGQKATRALDGVAFDDLALPVSLKA